MSYFQQFLSYLPRITTLLLIMLWSISSTASLRSFEAAYSSQWDLGISLSGKAKRSLIKNQDGSYRLTTSASAMVASLTESSLFNVTDDQILPVHYRYQRKILNKTRKVEVAFEWPNLKVENTAGGSSWVMDIVPGTLDKQSVQMRLQLDLAQTPKADNSLNKTYHYEVADGGHLKTYSFIIDGEDVIETPLGRYKSIRIKRDRGVESDRETWIWFAPELDYSIVKIVQKEADGKRYQLNLVELKWLDS
jgi:hypothetical protein|tara:strand:+ start:5487 stop:6233 length:747 start_codon:yes stop_codon:yes gene_type:complete